MLQQVCEHLNNYFIRDSVKGVFRIENGVFTSPLSLLEGQRFWVIGSALNDGVYTYHSTGISDDDDVGLADLQDEEFSGTVVGMAVPPAVITLAKDISDWQEKYADALSSPYKSESVIGVYSYDLKSGSGTSGSEDSIDWQSHFRPRLNRWRKICL